MDDGSSSSGSDMDSVSYGVGPQATMARASQYARHFQQMGSNHLGAVATAEDVYGDDDGDERYLPPARSHDFRERSRSRVTSSADSLEERSPLVSHSSLADVAEEMDAAPTGGGLNKSRSMDIHLMSETPHGGRSMARSRSASTVGMDTNETSVGRRRRFDRGELRGSTRVAPIPEDDEGQSSTGVVKDTRPRYTCHHLVRGSPCGWTGSTRHMNRHLFDSHLRGTYVMIDGAMRHVSNDVVWSKLSRDQKKRYAPHLSLLKNNMARGNATTTAANSVGVAASAVGLVSPPGGMPVVTPAQIQQYQQFQQLQYQQQIQMYQQQMAAAAAAAAALAQQQQGGAAAAAVGGGVQAHQAMNPYEQYAAAYAAAGNAGTLPYMGAPVMMPMAVPNMMMGGSESAEGYAGGAGGHNDGAARALHGNDSYNTDMSGADEYNTANILSAMAGGYGSESSSS